MELGNIYKATRILVKLAVRIYIHISNQQRSVKTYNKETRCGIKTGAARVHEHVRECSALVKETHGEFQFYENLHLIPT